MYVISPDGTLIIHPNKEGVNIIQYDFIKEIVENFKLETTGSRTDSVQEEISSS